MSDIENILAVIMGGGVGKRLFPLTKERAKPAVPIAGKYRLIDVTISNCINSHINRIAVLTQFNSVSLHRHISHTYRFDSFHGGWVQILAAEQTPLSRDWYQGTADAVRKQLFEIRSTGASQVLILAGDHLYRMDYRTLIGFHHEHNAEITVAVQPVSRQNAPRFGLLKREPDCRVTSFVEKPREPGILDEFVSRDDPDLPYLGSMGIYLLIRMRWSRFWRILLFTISAPRSSPTPFQITRCSGSTSKVSGRISGQSVHFTRPT